MSDGEVSIDTSQLTRMGAVAAMVVALAAAAWFWPSPDPPVPDVTFSPQAGIADQRSAITVHVSGAVTRPGLVEVPAGSRVADVLGAAGGVLPGADVASLNLAAPVRDGEQVVVAVWGVGAALGDRSEASDGLVRVNTADVVELQELPGVGPVLAQRIVAHRESEGPFAAVEDLLDVPGIGEGKLAALRDLVAIP